MAYPNTVRHLAKKHLPEARRDVKDFLNLIESLRIRMGSYRRVAMYIGLSHRALLSLKESLKNV